MVDTQNVVVVLALCQSSSRCGTQMHNVCIAQQICCCLMLPVEGTMCSTGSQSCTAIAVIPAIFFAFSASCRTCAPGAEICWEAIATGMCWCCGGKGTTARKPQHVSHCGASDNHVAQHLYVGGCGHLAHGAVVLVRISSRSRLCNGCIVLAVLQQCPHLSQSHHDTGCPFSIMEIQCSLSRIDILSCDTCNMLMPHLQHTAVCVISVHVNCCVARAQRLCVVWQLQLRLHQGKTSTTSAPGRSKSIHMQPRTPAEASSFPIRIKAGCL